MAKQETASCRRGLTQAGSLAQVPRCCVVRSRPSRYGAVPTRIRAEGGVGCRETTVERHKHDQQEGDMVAWVGFG